MSPNDANQAAPVGSDASQAPGGRDDAPSFRATDGITSGSSASRTCIVPPKNRRTRPVIAFFDYHDVFEDFSGAIKTRVDNDETLESTLVGITEADIIEAELQGKTAFVTIKCVSEQINVTRDAKGEVVDGDPGGVATVTDIWTFARNTRSRDPNWTLVATGSSN